MKNIISLLLVIAFSYNYMLAQTNDDEPLLPQNNEFFENFAEQLMESFNMEDLEEQMLQLSEQMQGYSDGFGNEPYQWIDSLKNGMMDGNGFFFLDPSGGDQLGMQFGEMQKMLQPMLDSMMNGGMFQQFNFGDMDGGMIDMQELFGNGEMNMGELRNFGSSKKTITEKLESEMWKDNLLQEEDINQIEITGKHLKINGKKQPKATFEKYRDMFENSQGHALTADSVLKLTFGNEKPATKKRRTQRI